MLEFSPLVIVRPGDGGHLTDPEGLDLDGIRAVRDEIQEHVELLSRSIATTA